MKRFRGRDRERAIARIADAMATERGTLPHEERLMAVWSLESYEEDTNRLRNRPLLHSILSDLTLT